MIFDFVCLLASQNKVFTRYVATSYTKKGKKILLPVLFQKVWWPIKEAPVINTHDRKLEVIIISNICSN